MQPYRPDRVVRGLSVLVSVAYYGVWIGIVLALVMPVGLKLFAGDDRDWTLGMPVRASVVEPEAPLSTPWGPARIQIEEVDASIRLPIADLPWSVMGVFWVYTAVTGTLALLMLRHLRNVFRRVRDGSPFDEENATRLRSVGVLTLALVLWNTLAQFVTANLVRERLQHGPIIAPMGLHIDVWGLIPGLVLIALAEIFRRGAQLEHEQSLVI